MRVAVFGKPAGGKSTLARQIAAAAGLPLQQLDLVRYEKGGFKVSDEEFAKRHAQILAQPDWVIDGFIDPRAFDDTVHAADVLVYVERATWIHYWWVTKRFLMSPVVKPVGWPEGSPMVSSTMSSYRFLRLSHLFWTSALKARLLALRSSKRVHFIHRQRDVILLLTELKALGRTSTNSDSGDRGLEARRDAPASG